MNFFCEKIRLLLFKNNQMGLSNIPKVLFSSVFLRKKIPTNVSQVLTVPFFKQKLI